MNRNYFTLPYLSETPSPFEKILAEKCYTYAALNLSLSHAESLSKTRPRYPQYIYVPTQCCICFIKYKFM